MTVRTIGTKRSQASSVISGGIVSYQNPDNSGTITYGSGFTSNTLIKNISTNVGTLATSTITISPPVITSYTVTDASYNNLDDTAVDSAGGYIKINGTNFSNNSLKVFANNSLVSNTYVSSTEIRAIIPAIAVGTYNLMVFNESRGAIFTNLLVSGFPSWTVSSYFNANFTVSVQLLATGDGTLTYSLYSGTLPTGLTLSANGLISGTVTADSVTSNLVVLVDDSQNQTTQQTISLTIYSIDPYWKYTTVLLNAEPGTMAWEDTSNLSSVVTVNGDTRPANRYPFATRTATDGSVYFDGTGDYLSYADSASLRIGTSDFTIEGWFYATNVTGQRGIIAKGPNAATTGWEIRVNGASGGALAMTYSSTVLAGSTVLVVNTWYHFALVRSGTATGNIKLYLNGVLEGTSSTARNDDFSQTDAMYIGYTRQTGTPQPFLGYISNVRVAKQAIYTAAFTPSTTALTTTSQSANSANVIFLSCQTNIGNTNNKIIDSSNNDIAVVRNNTVSQGAFTADGPNWSGYFDGTGDYLVPTSNTALAVGSGNFTIETWIYLIESTGVKYVAGVATSGAGTWQLGVNTANGLIKIYTVSNTLLFDSTANATLNNWNHIGLVRNSGTTTLYLNGTSAGSASDAANYSDGNLVIGAATTAGAQPWQGYLSNFRITKGQALYTGTFTPSTTPLTTTSQGAAAANVSILTCNTFQFKDNSPNVLVLTRNGDAAVTKFSPFNLPTSYTVSANGASYGFNGTNDYLSIASNALLNWGSGDFTFETWAYLNASSIPAVATVWDHRNNSAGVGVIQPNINVDSTNGYSFYTRAVTRFSSGTAIVKLRQWQHIAVVRSSGTTRMYVDGIQTGGTYGDGDNYPAGSVNIGRANDNVNTRFWPGYFYNMRLTVGSALYTANTTITTTPYNQRSNVNTSFLLTGTSGGIVDSSGLQNFYAVNDAKLSTVKKKYGTKSFFFDGNNDYLASANTAANLDSFSFGTGDFTIEGWLNTASVAAGFRTMIGTRTTTSDSTTGRFSFAQRAAALEWNSGGAATISAGTIVVDTWTHFAATRSSGNLRLFLDGTQVGSTTSYTANMPLGLILTIGDIASVNESFSGYLDEIRITKGYARYVANFTVPSQAFFTN